MSSAIFAENRTQQRAMILGLQSYDNNRLAVSVTSNRGFGQAPIRHLTPASLFFDKSPASLAQRTRARGLIVWELQADSAVRECQLLKSVVAAVRRFFSKSGLATQSTKIHEKKQPAFDEFLFVPFGVFCGH